MGKLVERLEEKCTVLGKRELARKGGQRRKTYRERGGYRRAAHAESFIVLLTVWCTLLGTSSWSKLPSVQPAFFSA